MPKFRIKFKREACIDRGTCAALCPENWELKGEGKASPKSTELEMIGCNKEAADNCPVQAIKIIEK